MPSLLLCYLDPDQDQYIYGTYNWKLLPDIVKRPLCALLSASSHHHAISMIRHSCRINPPSSQLLVPPFVFSATVEAHP